jgi:hypothetical protein
MRGTNAILDGADDERRDTPLGTPLVPFRTGFRSVPHATRDRAVDDTLP